VSTGCSIGFPTIFGKFSPPLAPELGVVQRPKRATRHDLLIGTADALVDACILQQAPTGSPFKACSLRLALSGQKKLSHHRTPYQSPHH
jgi:hypothetical protein